MVFCNMLADHDQNSLLEAKEAYVNEVKVINLPFGGKCSRQKTAKKVLIPFLW